LDLVFGYFGFLDLDLDLDFMIYTPIESPYQIVTKYAVLGIIWSEFPLKKFKKPFFHIHPKSPF